MMTRMVFLRKREIEIWIPTVWSWLLLLAASFALGLLLVRNIYGFLALNDPAGANILVVEGWLAPKELDQAIRVFRDKRYKQVITTGGPLSDWPKPVYGNYAEMAADYLAQHGIPRDQILVVPAPPSAQERTFLSAVMLRKAVKRLDLTLRSIDIFSAGAHARRSRLLFQMALGPTIHVGVMAARPGEYDPNHWWKTSRGVESIIFQSIGLAWVKCCFWPGKPDSPQELWGG